MHRKILRYWNMGNSISSETTMSPQEFKAFSDQAASRCESLLPKEWCDTTDKTSCAAQDIFGAITSSLSTSDTKGVFEAIHQDIAAKNSRSDIDVLDYGQSSMCDWSEQYQESKIQQAALLKEAQTPIDANEFDREKSGVDPESYRPQSGIRKFFDFIFEVDTKTLEERKAERYAAYKAAIKSKESSDQKSPSKSEAQTALNEKKHQNTDHLVSASAKEQKGDASGQNCASDTHSIEPTQDSTNLLTKKNLEKHLAQSKNCTLDKLRIRIENSHRCYTESSSGGPDTPIYIPPTPPPSIKEESPLPVYSSDSDYEGDRYAFPSL